MLCRNVSSKSTLRSLCGAALGLILGAVPVHSEPLAVTVTADDGVSCSLDLYRPPGPASVGVILLPDREGGRGDWAATAESLAVRGCLVGCLELRPLRAGGSPPVWGRAEDPLTPWTYVWRDVEAAWRRLKAEPGAGEGRPLVVGGAGVGAAVAAVAASRMTDPPAAVFLLQPAASLAGIPIAPILAGLEQPVLLIGPMEASEAREVTTDAYLASRPRSTFWMTAGTQSRPVQLIDRRPQLAIDLAGWIVGESSRPGGVGPRGAPSESPEDRKP